jgi:hypothetical protein
MKNETNINKNEKQYCHVILILDLYVTVYNKNRIIFYSEILKKPSKICVTDNNS